MEEKSNLYIVAIVAIVAVVGIITLIFSGGNIGTSERVIVNGVAQDNVGQAVATVNTICTETDAGSDPFTPGTASGSRGKFTDYCISSVSTGLPADSNNITLGNGLIEYYCENNTVKNTTYAWPGKDGLCVNGYKSNYSDGSWPYPSLSKTNYVWVSRNLYLTSYWWSLLNGGSRSICAVDNNQYPKLCVNDFKDSSDQHTDTFFIRGTLYGRTQWEYVNITDFCRNKTTLVEFELYSNGAGVKNVACQYGCDKGKCLPKSTAPRMECYYPNLSVQRVYDFDFGFWNWNMAVKEVCQYGCNVTTGVCLPSCQNECTYEGQKYCNGNYVASCSREFDYDTCLDANSLYKYCQYGCNNGVCKSAPPVSTCTAGTKCFDSSTVGYQTANCTWTNKTSCQYGCSNNKCNSAPTGCVDSDGGKAYTVYGTVTMGGSVMVDQCIPTGGTTTKLLNEFYCDTTVPSNVVPNAVTYTCPNSCVSGKCV